MQFSRADQADFAKDLAVVVAVERGRESSMYAPLRDIFVRALGYDRRRIDIDRSGARGRPDLTIFADGGRDEMPVSWIVVEAKDEHGVARDAPSRAELFREKAKYITADTAWFVMVDPTVLVARPVEFGTSSDGDIIVPLPGCDLTHFAERLAPLAAERAGVPQRLRRFRDGDEALIATERLSGPGDELAQRIARDAFFDGLRETTEMLQLATEQALAATRHDREAIDADVATFAKAFNGFRFTPYPIRIEGRPDGLEQAREHGRAAYRLTRRLAERPALARLTLDALPRFAERQGLDINTEAEARKAERFFAIETANLILARILLIRFLEDHGFFDETTPDGILRRRYLCNGGVQAFQGMRSYFGHGYTRLLEEAYRSGAGLYASAFNETELDWVLALASPELSRTVEWAMYRFSRYDFRTVRGDLLTGVYDRFLDARQRKAKGEFYTPPSLARWMLDKLDLAPDDAIMDPACGSGTFLIERYQQVVGEDADRGLASYEDACAAVGRIAGNDMNPFSAVLSQIQLLWHLITFGAAVRAQGLPLLPIAERANSLVPTILRDQSTTRFAEIDRDDYTAIVGNPPYVRPEVGIDLDPAARSYFEEAVGGHAGISVNRNLYRLFIYRALDHWVARPPGGRPGKLAFVLPLSFCSSEESADLRRLFAPGGRWTITRIVDLELIWRSVFDADVLPMILFAEARPASTGDRVAIHLAGEDCVAAPAVKGGRASFDLDRAAVADIAYADLFAPDGRILTRLTPGRLEIIRKLRSAGRLGDAAKRYWTRMRGGAQQVSGDPPRDELMTWSERRIIQRGATRRNQGVETESGIDLWKGENIRAGDLIGQPAFKSVDMSTVSSPSVWAYRHILPSRMFALPLIEQIPCAAPFNPMQKGMLDTVVLFGPRPDLEAFPFDTLLLSRVFGWYSILSLRASFMNTQRSHLYPTVIAALPWSEALAPLAETLHKAGEILNAACRRRFDSGTSQQREAEALGLRPLRDVVRGHVSRATLRMADDIMNDEAFAVGDVTLIDLDDGTTTILPDNDEANWLNVGDRGLATLLAAGLRLAAGGELNRTSLLRLPVPPNEEVARTLTELSSRYATDALEDEIERALDAIDAIVGPALGLSQADIRFVQRDMAEDPFLSRVRPRLPFFTPKQRGRRRNLERSDRYVGGAED